MRGTSPQQTSALGFAVHEALEPMITPTRTPDLVLGSATRREDDSISPIDPKRTLDRRPFSEGCSRWRQK